MAYGRKRKDAQPLEILMLSVPARGIGRRATKEGTEHRLYEGEREGGL